MVIEPKAERKNGKLSVGYIPGPNGTQHQSNTVYHTESVSPSLNATDYKNPIKVTVENEDTEPKAERIGGIFDKDGERHQAGAVWDKEQLAPTLDTMQGGWRQPSVFIKNNTKQGYIEATDGDGVDLAFPSSNTRRGRVQKDLAQTLDTSDSKGVVENLRIRKLTPKECWRLMGISDEDFEKAQEVNSNTQLYKQDGNAIVVDVLEAIFTNMFKQED